MGMPLPTIRSLAKLIVKRCTLISTKTVNLQIF